MDKIYGYRKFNIMLLFIITMVLCRVFNLINGTEFANNLQLSVVAFFGTNLGEHITSLMKHKK